MSRKGSINIGTSGWHYEHWEGPFYPEELPSDHFLAYYARYFQTAEVNMMYTLNDAQYFGSLGNIA